MVSRLRLLHMRDAVKCLVGSLLSGLMLVLALPLGEQGYLAWFAVVPVLVATRDRGFLVGFGCALISIFFGCWLSLSGLFYHYKDFEGSPAWVYTGFGLFGCSFALTVAMAAEKNAGRRPAWWFAAVAVLFESCLLLQLPAHLGLSQYRHLPMLLVASVGGIWLVSFLVWWVNVALSRLPARQFGLAGVGIVVAWFGTQHLTVPARSEPHRYAVVQVEEPGEENMTAAQKKAFGMKPEFSVWPEFGGMALVQGADTSLLKSISEESGPFVTSFRDTFEPLPHNVAALFSDGNESARYEKRKLFGGEVKMHTPGSKAVAVAFGKGALGLCICYDSCFPSAMRETARLEGVNVIALPTIDPHATHHFIAAMHASFSPFRAAEEGVSLVRGDGYAYSQIVDSQGRIVAEAPPGEKVLSAEVLVGDRWTVYKLLGDWFLYLCFGLWIFGWWLGSKKAKPEKPATS